MTWRRIVAALALVGSIALLVVLVNGLYQKIYYNYQFSKPFTCWDAPCLTSDEKKELRHRIRYCSEDRACETAEECKQRAFALGHTVRGNFAGDYTTAGCYMYEHGALQGHVYYGTSGTKKDNALPSPKKRIKCCGGSDQSEPCKDECYRIRSMLEEGDCDSLKNYISDNN